jgi:hypothetical protein
MDDEMECKGDTKIEMKKKTPTAGVSIVNRIR